MIDNFFLLVISTVSLKFHEKVPQAQNYSSLTSFRTCSNSKTMPKSWAEKCAAVNVAHNFFWSQGWRRNGKNWKWDSKRGKWGKFCFRIRTFHMDIKPSGDRTEQCFTASAKKQEIWPSLWDENSFSRKIDNVKTMESVYKHHSSSRHDDVKKLFEVSTIWEAISRFSINIAFLALFLIYFTRAFTS